MTGRSPGGIALVRSTNVGGALPNPASRAAKPPTTGISKLPVGSIEVFPVPPRSEGGASGVRGDFIGDRKHHGGDRQAVYLVAREDIDHWQGVLGRDLPDGWMGENLTTTGLDPNASEVGEIWRIGGATLQVTGPRVPCATFQAVSGRPGFLKEFTALGRTGAYLSVLEAGTIRPGDAVEVVERRSHGVTVQELFFALTVRPELAARALRAQDFLGQQDVERLEGRAAAL